MHLRSSFIEFFRDLIIIRKAGINVFLSAAFLKIYPIWNVLNIFLVLTTLIINYIKNILDIQKEPNNVISSFVMSKQFLR